MIAIVFGKASDAVAGKEFAQCGNGIKPNVMTVTNG
jgi:hypothetical protein